MIMEASTMAMAELSVASLLAEAR